MNESDVKLRECREAFEAEFMKLHSNNRLAIWNAEAQNYETLYARQLWKMWKSAWGHQDKLLEMAAEALREIMPAEIVQGDTVHRTHPASLQVFNSSCAWLVGDGERSAHKLKLRLEKAQQTLLTLQQHGYGKE